MFHLYQQSDPYTTHSTFDSRSSVQMMGKADTEKEVREEAAHENTGSVSWDSRMCDSIVVIVMLLVTCDRYGDSLK